MSTEKDKGWVQTRLDKINDYFKAEGIDAKAEAGKPTEKLDNLVKFAADKDGEEFKFEDITLLDGTVITVDPALEAGAAAVATTEEGVIPLPVGEYETQDGKVIVVLTEGFIEEIKETEAIDPEAEPMADGEVQSQIKTLIERVEKVTEFEAQAKEKIEALEKENKELKERLHFQEKETDAIKVDVAEFKTVAHETFEAILSKPEKEPAHKVKNPLLSDKPERTNIFTSINKTKKED